MKLKYYLRGMGIGIILTAIVMGFALGGRKSAISDAEIIQRAKALGMVEEGGTLTQATWEAARIDEEETTASSGEALDGTGNKILEENEQQASGSDLSADSMAEPSQEVQNKGQEAATEAGSTDSKGSGEKTEEVNQKIVETNLPGENLVSASASSSNISQEDNAQSVVKATDTSALSSTGAAATAQTSLQISDSAVPLAASASSSLSDGNTSAGASSTNALSADASTGTTKSETAAASASSGEATDTAAASISSGAATDTAAAAASTAPVVAGRNVTIPKGCGSDTVAQILFKEGLVDNAVSFNQFLVTTGMDRKLRAGVKNIPEDGDYQHIAEVLIQG
ncbi:MAG: endolytic transglycosylase MltG [Butyrivibrio sp.]|nr:endolytic transglycosylase MltG [Butyrivibrio sp.]